jgi:hypothetical protein
MWLISMYVPDEPYDIKIQVRHTDEAGVTVTALVKPLNGDTRLNGGLR